MVDGLITPQIQK
jgi:hypothetical protein